MKTTIKLILYSFVLLANLAHAERLYGLERMERLDLLPYFLEGTQVRQVSGYDRSGENDDGFVGTYSSLYVDMQGEYVLFDEIGAGCLYRFWMTYLTDPAYAAHRLRFYFDNETNPRLDMSIDDFFNGTGAPLEFPMVGRWFQSSHGCYCYVPFPYRERLKITLSGLPLFYNMTYHHFDSPDDVASWTGTEDQSAVMAQWDTAGTDPKPAESNLVVAGSLPMTAGSTGTLYNVTGGGCIQRIKLDPTPANSNTLAHIWLQMNWDGGEPEVDVPLGDFFGSGKDEVNVTSLPIGMKTAGDWYCYFPMPYWESASIQLVSKGSEGLVDVPFEIQYTTNVYDRARAGYFHAVFKETSFVGDGSDVNFIDERGRGHMVGLSLFMKSTGVGGYKNMNYLEGDERVHVDGNGSPCIHGTGSEDYFNSGWYFNQGTFSLPYHGHPWRDQFNDSPPNYTQAYRFHLSDIIPFNSSVKFGIEHGTENGEPGIYSSVTYYYKTADTVPGMMLVADLDLDDVWSQSVYNYQAPQSRTQLVGSWQYGSDDDTFISDQGNHFRGISEFAVPLPVDNEGLMLRRRTDQGVGGQKAHVFIDEAYAGIWYEADHNFTGTDRRWLDSEFMIPASLVDGKTAARISLVVLSADPVWNEYHYEVYSIKPLAFMADSDEDQLPDEWELDMVSSLGTLRGEADSDDDGFSDLSEYIAGTHPTNAASFFNVQSPLSFQSELGRLYQIQQCTSLLSNNWVTIRSGIPGIGARLDYPIETLAPTAYHRLQVEMP